ncbi:MAG: exo-alpha-sialidase [Myxococcales bacterium]|nr:exo-alpha-sialidase [Myxococcales bacterium]
MMRSLRCVLTAITLALFSAPLQVQAHGGLPVSQQILWQDQTMLVPTPYWGVFLGSDGGPWHWICEEAINPYQMRRFARGQDGTLYATDRIGLTVSRDGGCTWKAVSSGIHAFQISAIAGDPLSPRVWALATDEVASGTGTGLWRSEDAGNSWQLAYAMKGHYPIGLVIAQDGQTLALTSAAMTTPITQVLHVSRDGGLNFQSQTVAFQVNGRDIGSILPLWIDPRSPDQIYVATRNLSPNVLLRVGLSGPPSEIMRVDTGIWDMTRDAPRDQILVATSRGLWSALGSAALQPTNTLSASQCISVHGQARYVCAWNYAPDMAAIARLSDDATSFTPIFQFHDTLSPIACSADTPVGTICPPVWQTYADQLGINLDERQKTSSPGACQISSHASQSSGWLGLLLALCLARLRNGRRVALHVSKPTP